MFVKIITDSASDLPKNLCTELNIDVLPLNVYVNGKEFEDNVNIHANELFEDMRQGRNVKTSGVPLTVFEDKFRKLAKDNGSYIYLSFSSQLSGTYQTSKLAYNDIKDEYPDFDLEIVDTLCASLGFGFVVVKAAQMAKEGCTKEQILNSINFYINHIEHIFTVDDIEYLYRGGRVTKTAAFIGTVLNIKPVLDVQNGKLIPIDKIRGRRKTIHKMIELVGKRGKRLENQTVGINHGDDLATAEYIRDSIKEKYNVESFLINDIGSAVGSHTGPGVIGIYFLNEWPCP
ncbi:DegV family protein [Clostridium grantii]|uniref:EDD domain protein, DegV family n=1 Tax=Clostridium grantii DSM 8605 TaxID=1121316 RepID=A0A1M5VQ47_9CLOT|nr:DegV family protein [Clostridium grantii]SHH77362.1 EDD domain protein, DegV family [Clostridium grantii DSM 8605]